MNFGVPKEKIVMMGGHTYKVFGPNLFIERHQLLRIPSLGFPQRNNVFIPEFRRVAIVGYVIFVIRTTFFVHLSGIPVALAWNGLWSPMCPDSKFCIPEPFRILILFK